MVATAGFKGLHGYTGETNSHGDEVKLIDEEADEVLVELLGSSGHFGLLVSEERDSVVTTDVSHNEGKYVLAFDPLDGSSNIGSSIPTGTIFCIFRKRDPARPAALEDFRQPGTKIVAAGYSVYGAKTSFVYSTGSGVHGFTLDPSIGEFVLTDQDIRVPDRGSVYSVNEGNSAYWGDDVKEYIAQLKMTDATAKGPYSGRYVGSLVADFDRTLRKGGVFLYPTSSKHPQGRLRLLYECMPLAFIIENAGGAAINGAENLIDVVPSDIHEKSALITGSPFEVALFREISSKSRARGLRVA
jgi:fructose-1,6-bisphosphatase I